MEIRDEMITFNPEINPPLQLLYCINGAAAAIKDEIIRMGNIKPYNFT
jgi:hypothetical protein